MQQGEVRCWCNAVGAAAVAVAVADASRILCRKTDSQGELEVG